MATQTVTSTRFRLRPELQVGFHAAGFMRRLFVTAFQWVRGNPTAIFLLFALASYGSAAIVFGNYLDHLLPAQDAWQHVATLKALIADPYHPSNPFVITEDPSRHFHPYWVSAALVARLFGWDAWQALSASAFLSFVVLSFGIYVFASAYYRHKWGAVALLAAMLLSWHTARSYTGYHSWATFARGGGYPAMLLIGLSLIAWGATIRALERRDWHTFALIPLTALMFMIHQLGAAIGLFVMGCIVMFWPGVSLRAKVQVSVAVIFGLALAALWPYYNPFEAVLLSGNPTWPDGYKFFSINRVVEAIIPSSIGLFGLWRPLRQGTGRPIIVALAGFTVVYCSIPFGIMLGERFLMPAMLMLHIGMATVFLRVFSPNFYRERLRIAFVTVMWSCAVFATVMHFFYFADLHEIGRNNDDVRDEAEILTRNIPDTTQVAAHDIAAWPVVAAGQRVVSIPWPEPLIRDLSERQAANRHIFTPGLSKLQRLQLAKRWGATILIVDERYVESRLPNPELLRELVLQSVRVQRAGHLWRFDLAPVD